MPTVKAMTITIDSLPPRLKLDSDVGYNAAVKGASIVVKGRVMKLQQAMNNEPALDLACTHLSTFMITS
jgi:hypothetical protein